MHAPCSQIHGRFDLRAGVQMQSRVRIAFPGKQFALITSDLLEDRKLEGVPEEVAVPVAEQRGIDMAVDHNTAHGLRYCLHADSNLAGKTFESVQRPGDRAGGKAKKPAPSVRKQDNPVCAGRLQGKQAAQCQCKSHALT